jgi:hypothetical protein
MKEIQQKHEMAEAILKDIEKSILTLNMPADYQKTLLMMIKHYGDAIQKVYNPAINMLENLITSDNYDIRHMFDLNYDVTKDIKDILDALNEAFAGCYDIVQFAWDDLPDFVVVQELMDKYDKPQIVHVSVDPSYGSVDKSKITESSHALVISNRGMAESTAMVLYERWLIYNC